MFGCRASMWPARQPHKVRTMTSDFDKALITLFSPFNRACSALEAFSAMRYMNP